MRPPLSLFLSLFGTSRRGKTKKEDGGRKRKARVSFFWKEKVIVDGDASFRSSFFFTFSFGRGGDCRKTSDTLGRKGHPEGVERACVCFVGVVCERCEQKERERKREKKEELSSPFFRSIAFFSRRPSTSAPGIHPNSVSKMLTKNVTLIPETRKTARGGRRMALRRERKTERGRGREGWLNLFFFFLRGLPRKNKEEERRRKKRK